MKRACPLSCLLLTVLFLVPAASAAQPPPVGYIGLYTDSLHTTNEVWNPGGMHQFTMYICCLPGENGMICAEFGITYPANVIPGPATEHPGVSVTLGSLDSGKMSVCFYDCRTDWVWTHAQVLYLTDTEPSNISLVPHPEVGAVHFANCDTGYPTESVYYSPRFCLNSTCVEDTVPPGLAAAVAPTASGVRVFFSEPLFAPTAADTANYEVYPTGAPSAPLALNAASLVDDGTVVRLSLLDDMDGGTSYTVRVNDVEDSSGNPILPQSTISFSGIDGSPPHLTLAVATSDSTVDARFNEYVTAYTAEVTSNYLIWKTEGGYLEVDIGSAELLPDSISVRLHLDTLLSGGGTFNLRVLNVEDLAGNAMATSTLPFTAYDTEPPELLSASVASRQLVDARFSETLNRASAEDAANYKIYRTGDPSDSLIITQADLLSDSSVVRIWTADTLEISVPYTLRVSGVKDLAMNEVAPGSEAAFMRLDTAGPFMTSAVAVGDSVIGITFNEPLDSATAVDATNYAVLRWTPFDSLPVMGDSVLVTEAELRPDSMHVWLTLGQAIDSTANYTIYVNHVEDLWGNAILHDSEITIWETVLPEIVSADAPDLTHLDVTFGEPLDEGTAENAANYLVFVTADTASTIGVTGAELLAGDVTARLSLDAPIVFDIPYTLRVTGIEDRAGNMILPGSETEFTLADLFPPQILSAALIPDSLVEVAFDEKLDPATAENTLNYGLFELAGAIDSVPVPLLAAALIGDSSAVRLTAGDSLSARNTYVLLVSGVEDPSGNPVPPGTSVEIRETYPPEIDSVAVTAGDEIEAVFSEDLDETTAEDEANYELFLTADSSATFTVLSAEYLVNPPDSTYRVRLTLGSNLSTGVSHTLRVTGVEDGRGNPIAPGSEILFIPADIYPPELVFASASSANIVKVVFDEALDPATATEKSNYQAYFTANPAATVPVAFAALAGGGKEVSLSLGGSLTPGSQYTVEVSNVEDVHGNPIAPNSTVLFTFAPDVPVGSIGLYADDAHSNACADGVGIYPVEMWIWCLPGENGQRCVEFAVSYPVNVIQSTVTESPLLSVYLGDLASGMSACYSDCQYDWNWPFHQSLWVTDSNPTTVEIVKHPEPSIPGIQFANCLEGYPIEPASVCSKLLINCSQHPPEILTAEALTGTIVSVGFSKALDETTAESPGNYEIFETDSPADTIGVVTALLQPDGTTVTLELAGPLTPSILYTVRVNNVEDTEGRTVPPNSEKTFIYGTGLGPVLLSVWASDDEHLFVNFNENLDETTSEEESNYDLFVTGSPADFVPIGRADLQANPKIVGLELGTALVPATTYTLRVSNVEDTQGNPIAPGSEIEFLYKAGEFILRIYEQTGSINIYTFRTEDGEIYDSLGTPGPTGYGYDGFDFGTTGCEYFDVYFSDSLGNEAGLQAGDSLPDPLYFTVVCMDLNCNNMQPDPPLYWSGAGCNLDAVCLAQEGDTLWGVVHTRVEYGLCQQPLETKADRFASNALGPPDTRITAMGAGLSVITMRLGSGEPPPLLNAARVNDPAAVRLLFSKELDEPSAETVSNYSIFETASPVDSVSIAGATLDWEGETVDLAIGGQLAWNTDYTVTVTGVTDTGGQPVLPGTQATFVMTDTVPPHLSIGERISPVIVYAAFDEFVDSTTASDPANYEIFELGDSTATIGIASAEQQINPALVYLTLSDSLDAAVSYILRVSNVEDPAGNPIPEGSEIILYETVRPFVADIGVLSQTVLEVTFSEPVDSGTAALENNYAIYETIDSTRTITVGQAEPVDSIVVRLALDDTLRFGIDYTLRVGDVYDLAGNRTDGTTRYHFTAEDIFPPEIAGAWALSEMQAEIAFNEPVDSATACDPANYILYELLSPSDSIVVSGATRAVDSAHVLLDLADSLSPDTDYILRVSNVEDLAGNPIDPGSEVVIYETAPPTLEDLTVIDQYTLDLLFSEPVDSATAEETSSYLLHVAGDSTATVQVYSAELRPDTVTARLTLGKRLEGDTTYTLRVQDVEDLAGNPVPPGTQTDFLVTDVWPPVCTEAQAMSELYVRCFFDEVLDDSTSQDAANYELFRTANPADTITIDQAVLAGGGVQVILYLSRALSNATLYTVRINNVEDLAGNPVAPNTEKTFTTGFGVADGYIGLYVDMDHTENEVWYETGLTPFTLYVWCLPGDNGMMCAEYAISYSSNVIRSTVTVNPFVSVTLGTLPDGMSVCYAVCQEDWVWTHGQSCYLADGGVGSVEVIPHPDIGVYQFANCLPGYPTEPADLMSKIYLNDSEEPPGTMLESFAASYRSSGIELQWTLSEMEDGTEFVVLRSEEGNGVFGALPAGGLEREGLTFTFVDALFESGKSYRYRVEYEAGGELCMLFETEAVTTPAMPVTLFQNRPNPFNPHTTIGYYLPAPGRVVLEIYDVSGRLVRRLVDGLQEQGRHEAEWDGADRAGSPMSSGVYFYRLVAGKTSIAKKMILLR